MIRPPTPDREAERLAALRKYEILDTAPEPAFDDLVRLASQIMRAPIALVSLVDADRQFFKAEVGLGVRETGRDVSFCAHSLPDPSSLLVVPDATRDHRFHDNPLVTGGPRIRFYAGTPLVDADGHALGTLCVIDRQPRTPTGEQLEALATLGRQVVRLLELRLANRELINLARRAEDATRAKAHFLANMSHELRTPLTAIIGFADLITDSLDDRAALAEHADTIRHNGRHLLRLINDLLDFSKIEAGGMKIEPAEVRLRAALEQSLKLVRPAAAARGVELSFEPDRGLPQVVRVDPVRLEQVLLNLLGNAVKFTDRGGKVTLRAAARTEGPDVVRLDLSVIDTGVGLSLDQIGALFKPFVQADMSPTRKAGGTGLGLSISRHLARLMGGDIDVESEPGVGSRFTLTLRAVPASLALGATACPNDDAAEPLAAGTAATSTEPPAERRFRVLVAEDGPDNQRLIAHVLRRVGVDFEIVTDGITACDFVASSPPDLVLLDVQMPGRDGLDAARHIRAAGYRGPVIALTAHAGEADRRKCLDAGCDDFVAKPFDLRQLQSLLQAKLAARAA
jgi:signal transduction histidine kinase/ActR/RegA family two-component response regulator